MRSLIALAIILLTAGCAATPGSQTPPGQADIGRGGVRLVLPAPPGFPGERTLLQSIVAVYGERRMAFDVATRLSPSAVRVVVAAPAGPQIAQIAWTKDGVTADGPAIGRYGLRPENLLADAFLTLWPPDAICAAISRPCAVRDGDDGARTILVEGRPLIEIGPREAQPGGTRQLVHNTDFGYRLTVTTISDE